MLTADQTSHYTPLTDKAIERCKNWLGRKKVRREVEGNHLEHLQLIVSTHSCTLNLHITII